MTTFVLLILVLVAWPSLLWHLLCAGRWLRRRLWPTFSEQVDARFRPYNPKPLPHPLWANPLLTPEEVQELFSIPQADAGPSLRLNARPSPELPSVNLATDGTRPPTISTPKTVAGSSSTRQRGQTSSPGNMAGPGSE